MLDFLQKTNRFHLIVAVCWQFSLFFAIQMIFPIFSSYIPRWRCALNQTTASIAMPYGRNCTEYDLCQYPNAVEFEHIYFQSAALEFNWVCGSKAYLNTLFAQVQFAGVFIGTHLFGGLSDCFGRKLIGMIVLGIGIPMVVLSGLSPTGELLIASRFLIGLCNGGTLVVLSTFSIELLLPEQRIPLRAFFNWGVSRMMMTLVCYFFPEWRIASFACAACAMPAFLLVAFVIPESPIWLHNKGRLEQMRTSERKIARIANVAYEEVHHDPIPVKPSFSRLIRDPALLSRVSVLWLMWFVASMSSYTNDLSSNTIVGSFFFNQVLFCAFIILAKMLLLPFDAMNFSRRNLHQYSQFGVIICFLAMTYIVWTERQGIPLLIINLIGCAFLEYTWDACVLCAVEAMPTEMRATAVGSCSMVARIGSILAPTLAFLNNIWAPSGYLTVACLGTVSLIVSYKWLVETRGVDLDIVKLHEENASGEVGKHIGEIGEKEKMLEMKNGKSISD